MTSETVVRLFPFIAEIKKKEQTILSNYYYYKVSKKLWELDFPKSREIRNRIFK